MNENYSENYKKDFVLILVAGFCFMACPMLTTPLITGYTKTLGATGAVMGLTAGLMNLCSMVCRPFAGNFADLTSKYKLAMVGAGIMFISCMIYAFSSDMVVIMAARIFNGVGFSLTSVAVSTWLACMLPPNKIGSGMGMYGMMNALSMGIAPVIGIKVQELFGYKASFCTAAVFMVILIVIVQFISYKGEVEMTSEERKARKSDLKLIEPKVVPIAIITILFTIPYFATQSFIVGYVDDRNLAISVSLFFPVYAAALLILRLRLRKYFDSVAYEYFVYASSACALLAMVCMWQMEGNLLMFAAAVFMAGSYGIMCTVSQSNAIIIAGKDKKGLANSTYYLGLDIGMASGPILGGLIYANVDISMFYPVLMVTVPLILIVIFIYDKINVKG